MASSTIVGFGSRFDFTRLYPCSKLQGITLRSNKSSELMKRLILTFTILLFPLQAVISANTQEGFIKFLGKKNAVVFLEVADTPEKKEKGLMNRPSLPQNRGMVFIFKPKTKVTFWMKDTLIPLDMIFIDRGRIVKIVKSALPNQTDILYPSDYAVTEVVEVNGGYSDKHNITAGDRIAFKNIPQIDYSKNSNMMTVTK